MKVLLISDNKENIDFVDSYMKANGFDLIVYKWLIKAIDNIEEIKPDYIIVSASEYPRHWKTLASFVQSGIGGDNVKLYLYEPIPLSEEEDKKAKALGVEGYISDFNEEQLSHYFSSEVDGPQNSQDVVVDEPNEVVSDEIVEEKTAFIFTNPDDGSLVSGKVLSKTNDEYNCKVDIEESGFEKGQLLKEVSVYADGKVVFFSAYIKENDNKEGILSLSVSDYYEEI